ncbi:MAG: hypothetical protein EBT78_08060 [Betaproteobacteria bacterium]|nr:hypothetical protein [Betaproteobacteria bacterium]
MGFVIASSSAGTPFEYDKYTSGATGGSTTTDTRGNDQAGDTHYSSSNINAETASTTATASGSHSFLNVDTNGNFNGGVTTYSGSGSSTYKRNDADTSGSTSSSYTNRGQTFSSTYNQDGGDGGNVTGGFSGSDSGSYTLDPATFEKTTIISQTFFAITTNTSTDSEDYYGLWFLTTEPSNTLGTELAYTSTAKRPVTSYVEVSSISVLATTSETCIRSHKKVFKAYTPFYKESVVFVNFETQEFLFKDTNQPSFNSNGLYLYSDIAPMTAGFTTSNDYTFATEHKNIVPSRGATYIAANDLSTDPNNTYEFVAEYDTSTVDVSFHSSPEYSDALANNYFLSTTSTTNAHIASANYTGAFGTSAFRNTDKQINEALYGAPDTSVGNYGTNQGYGYVTIETFIGIYTYKTRIGGSSFYGSSTHSYPYLFIVKTTISSEFIANFSTSSTQSVAGSGWTDSGTSAYNQSRGYYTNYSSGYYYFGYGMGAQRVSGDGNGLKITFNEANLIDFVLQDPYSKGTAYPIAKELIGGFSTMGLVSAGYPNPANFFNYTDNLVGDMAVINGGKGDGNVLNPIQACHRLNLSAIYAGDSYGMTNASCPPTQNTTASWLSIPSNTTGTSQFITYSFGTSPTYSITTANKRSNPTATITSGTTTKNWSTAGSLQTGYRDLGVVFDYWEQTAQISTYALTYLTPDNKAYIVTDWSSNGSSTTATQRGFLAGDLSPQSVIPHSATRYLGYKQNANIAPQVGGEYGYYLLSATPLAYARPHPTSWLGFYGHINTRRLAGGSVGEIIGGYPQQDVTAQFSDPSF